MEPLEIGVLTPAMLPTNQLHAGEVGYIATGLKTLQDLDVGDTITLAAKPATELLPGYQPMKPMVFAGLYPSSPDDYTDLRDALEKLQLNDAALVYEPETSQALGFGFRLGFLGLFHMEIIQERLEREYDLDVIFTAPVGGISRHQDRRHGDDDRQPGRTARADPDRRRSRSRGATCTSLRRRTTSARSWIWSPSAGVNCAIRTGSTPSASRSPASIPLSEIIVDFYNDLKARTAGYASMDYTLDDYRASDMVKLDILVNQQPVDALSVIVHRDDAFYKGQRLVSKMKEIIPRQMFEVPIQAAVGNKIISRANVKAMRKDVLSKCYGGDVTRKRKLLEKQKAGKKRMKMVGSVEIPQEAFMSVLKLDDD